MDPTQLLAYLRLPTKVLAAVAVSALVMVLIPEDALSTLGLAKFREDYRWALGAAVIIPVALLLVEAAVALFSLGQRKIARRQQLQERREAEEQKRVAEQAAAVAKRVEEERERAALIEKGKQFLQGMTDPEKEICRKFIDGKVRTHWLNAEYGVVSELQRRGVIYQSNQHMHVDLNFQGWGAYFTMCDWAWEYLNAQSDLIVDVNAGQRGKRR